MLQQIIKDTLKMAKKAYSEEIERKNFNIAFKIQDEIMNLEMQLSMIN